MASIDSVTSTGVATVSGQVFTGRRKLHGVFLTPAAAASTITIYDNTAASGTAILVLSAPASGATTYVEFNSPIEIKIGVNAVLSGVGASYFLTTSIA